MAAGLRKATGKSPEVRGSLSFEERFRHAGLTVTGTWRENQALTRRLKEVQALFRALRRKTSIAAIHGKLDAGHAARP